MTTRYYTKSKPILPSGRISTVDYSLVSTNSERNSSGKLVLKPNTLFHREDRLVDFYQKPGGPQSDPGSVILAPQAASLSRDSQLPPNFDWAPQETRARARFDGKLRYGSASLGVTIASWRQSHDMIVKRFGTLTKSLDRVTLRLAKDKRLLRQLRRKREPLAGQVLEGEFGWAPLVQDVKAAVSTVIQHGVPPERVRVSDLAYWKESRKWSPQWRQDWEGVSRLTYKADVIITNPHLWMANRAGLLNLPGVLWDLVPWSFVANMFGNFNQLISSFTNECGIEIYGHDVTRTVKMITIDEFQYPQFWNPPLTRSQLFWKARTRTLGSAPPISLQLKVPDFDWNLAVIASALVVQRIKTLNNLIRVL